MCVCVCVLEWKTKPIHGMLCCTCIYALNLERPRVMQQQLLLLWSKLVVVVVVVVGAKYNKLWCICCFGCVWRTKPSVMESKPQSDYDSDVELCHAVTQWQNVCRTLFFFPVTLSHDSERDVEESFGSCCNVQHCYNCHANKRCWRTHTLSLQNHVPSIESFQRCIGNHNDNHNHHEPNQ